jgi:hypothetical protein
VTNAEAGRSSGVQAIRVLFKAGMVAWIEVGSFEIVRLSGGFEFKYNCMWTGGRVESVDQPAKKAKDVLQRVCRLVPGFLQLRRALYE